MELYFSYDGEEQVYVVSIQHYPVSGAGITLSDAIADFKKDMLIMFIRSLK